MTTKRFTLHVPRPTRSTPLIQFEGTEFASLKQASEAIIGRYGFKTAMEIFGRVFVLTMDEAHRFAEQKLPFTLGFASKTDFTAISVNDDGPKIGVRWLPDSEVE